MSISPLPGDASNDPSTDQTGRFVRQPNGRVRPLSPHLQIWRFHLTMAGSILNRLAAGAYHLTAGVRHLIWDTGAGMTPKTATNLTIISMVAAVVIVVVFWGALFMSGRVVL